MTLDLVAVAVVAAGLPAALPEAAAQSQEGAPINRGRVNPRTAQAANYRQGSTRIGFKGTAYMPFARGEARIQNRDGRVAPDARLEQMEPASKFGPPFMTYELWAVTPEGNARDLGPLTLERGRTRLEVTTNLQSFAMIVTAEPYYAVTAPGSTGSGELNQRLILTIEEKHESISIFTFAGGAAGMGATGGQCCPERQMGGGFEYRGQ